MTHDQWAPQNENIKLKAGEKKATQPNQINKIKLNVEIAEDEEQSDFEEDFKYPIILNYLHKDQKYEEDSSFGALHKVIDAKMHKHEHRVTYMIRGKSSYTFEWSDDKEKENQVADMIYCIESDDVRFVFHRNRKDLYV